MWLIPHGLRKVFVFPAPAGLHDADPVALLRRPERSNTSTEARADNRHVEVEARHGRSPFVHVRLYTCRPTSRLASNPEVMFRSREVGLRAGPGDSDDHLARSCVRFGHFLKLWWRLGLERSAREHRSLRATAARTRGVV